MSPFGTSVAAYTKKPNTVLQKTLAPAPTEAPTTAASVGTNPSLNQQQTPTKTALGGSTAPVASGFMNNIQTPIYQPLFSAQMGDKSNSIYGRLNAINQTSDVRDQESASKVQIANSRINNWNQRMARNQSTVLDGDFQGNGDSGLDAEQLDNARAIAEAGRARGINDKGIQIALMTALTESGLRNLNRGDRDSLGLFQQRPSQGWGTPQQVTDRTYATNKFYDALAKTNFDALTPWQAAQSVQKSFDPTGSNYQKQYALAQRAYNAIYNPTARNAPNTTANGAQSWINQYNNRYVDYDGQFGAQCVDLYNFYTTGFVGGDPMMGRVRYAGDIFNNYDPRVYQRLAGRGQGRMGDVAVFGAGPGTPSTHVAIVVGDNGDGTLRVLQANATARGSAGPTIISNISKSTLMGYLRPNKLGA